MSRIGIHRFIANSIDAIISQGGASVFQYENGPWSCGYRGKNGRKCAVGQHVSDHDYRKSMEGNDYFSLPLNNREAVEKKIIGEHHSNTIRQLQQAHDDAGIMRLLDGHYGPTPDAEFFPRFLEALNHRLVDDILDHPLVIAVMDRIPK